MSINGIISAIIVGLIIGALGRLVIPGKQPIGLLLTFLLGLIGAFVGGYIGAGLGAGFVIIVILQVAIAALLVFLVSGGMRGRARM
jgi:uncharacterized membrane protein YeaQ/YmgE (transglycosylase-associated protein family)